MEFVITRTGRSEEKPCEGAYTKNLTYLRHRNVKSIEEAKKYPWFEEWFQSGTNHRVDGNSIVCDSKEKSPLWVIDISKSGLLEFQEKSGEPIILSKSRYKEIEKEIEIYDDYRE